MENVFDLGRCIYDIDANCTLNMEGGCHYQDSPRCGREELSKQEEE